MYNDLKDYLANVTFNDVNNYPFQEETFMR